MTAPRKMVIVLALGVVFALGFSLRAVALKTEFTKAQPADTILIHGKVYTVNAKQLWSQAVAIRGEKIVAVGNDSEIEKLRGPQTKLIDAGGKLVLPGFVDCHIHFLDGSIGLGQANLDSAKNPAGIQRILREYADKHPDELFPNRPVFLFGSDGHTSWANSKALALAGINKYTPDPANGGIVRDPKTGEATGALKESASSLVGKLVPKPTPAEKLTALRAGIHWANENGLTRVHSAGGDFEEFALYDELRRSGELTLRMYIAYFLNPPELRPQDIDAIEEARKKYTGDWLSGGAVKMMIDGVIESHTAAMLVPYTDDPSTKGKLFWDPDKYKAAVAELDKRGLQLFTHAIGDYAV